jgi:hypothetical protein
MTTHTVIMAELIFRLSEERRHFHDVIPQATAIAWRGYLAGLYEWKVLTLDEYDELKRALPDVDDDPSVAILLGRGCSLK